jgi:poly(A) polymerase
LGLPPADLDWLVPDPAMSARRQADALGGSVFALDEERDHWRVVGPVPDEGDVRVVHDFVRAPNDPADDLWRRDLTINALAARPDGSVLDPTGGLADLRRGVVRMTSRGSLEADDVRPLRAVRFAGTLGFALDGDTSAAIRELAVAQLTGSVPRPAQERVRDELVSIVSHPRGAAALGLAAELGLLATFLPELDAARGVEQGGLHHLDVFGHSLQALASLAEGFPAAGTDVRLATLLHDIGKPATAVPVEGFRVTFHGHAKLGALLARRAMRRLRFGSDAVAAVGELVRLHMVPLPSSDRGARRFVHRYRHALPGLLWLMIADREAARGKLASAAGREAYRKALGRVIAVWQEPAPATPLVTGHDVMHLLNLPPGPRVGEALALVEESVAVGDVATVADAERLLRGYAKAQGWSD